MSSGGAERVTATLSNYWAKKGWQVTIVTVTSSESDFYALDKAIERIALGLDRGSASMLAGLLNNARRVYALRRVLRQVEPDVAISMMSTANCLLALAGSDLPLRTVGSERIYPPAMPLGLVWDGIRRWCYSRLDVLVAQTAQSADWLRANAPARAVEVIPNSVTFPMENHESTIQPYMINQSMPNTKYVLLSVGRLEEQKGFDNLLDVFASLASRHPNWQLVILGEGKLRGALEEKITTLQLTESVYLPGAISNVGDWYDAADAYVLTSLYEGFPNTLLEALAHGLPAVAVDCDTGPRDIIRHNTNGLLVPQEDPIGLREALDLLMCDEQLRKKFGECAVEVRQQFSVQSVADMWESLFDVA